MGHRAPRAARPPSRPPQREAPRPTKVEVLRELYAGDFVDIEEFEAMVGEALADGTADLTVASIETRDHLVQVWRDPGKAETY